MIHSSYARKLAFWGKIAYLLRTENQGEITP
jgi:hypothetical protein